ncbi:F-type H+-transporting ATPase subunit beta [Mycoplasma testudineum]|uniref:F-type H+-transporting ATPase subunit beta n=1 Tax=Mycoplasma testudineum TaxID=244584 RepID=A0A4V3C2T2_9MOLU|nr:F0F1 ATP synthase subunit beta [Mycoplasma testudineum]OYD26512.1 F0F1 ATP synthase subunit beta [Mycoplasma testudineum]TDO18999.1 F-type H+-transporting ATPase subunit beta [Mycoplasma testudineum]
MASRVINVLTNVVELELDLQDQVSLKIDNIFRSKVNSNILQLKKIISNDHILAIVIDAEVEIRIGDVFENTKRSILVPVGQNAKNKVFDIRGNEINTGKLPDSKFIEMNSLAKRPKSVKPHNQIMETGIKVIDFFIPIIKGHKLGILGGAGVGKTVLMKEIIFNSNKGKTKTSSIFIGSGERSREGLELYEELRESNLMKNTTMFVAQMNESPGARMNIVPMGISAAEYLRDYEKEDVFVFIDNIYRFLQGANEISSSLGKKPSLGGYQSTLSTDVAEVQDRLHASQNNAITSFQTVFLPMDDLSDPAAVALFDHLDGTLVLSREQVAKNLYPAFDPLSSNSNSVNPQIIGEKHFQAILEAKAILQKYKELEDVILILGIQELDKESQIIVEKALQLQNFFTQRFFVAQNYTKQAGVYVTLEDTVNSVIEIINGKYLGVHPEKFSFIGTTRDLATK